MGKEQQVAKANPFGKPKAAADGNFEFRVPADFNPQGNRGRIPKGPYIGRCTSIIFEHSKSSNNPMWTWEFTITKGKIGVGRAFKLWTVLTDDAAWKVVETLSALGIEIGPGEKIKINKKDVIGVGCTMHIVDDDGQDGDEEWSKLKKISAHPEGAGYRPGKLGGKVKPQEEDEDDDRDYPREMDESGEEEEDQNTAEEGEEGEEEEEDVVRPSRRTARRAAEVEEEEEDGGSGDDDDVADELLGEDDEEEEQPPARRRPAPSKAPSKPARGKAPASLGGGKKRR